MSAEKRSRSLPFAGIAVVFRRQRRGRRLWQEISGAFGLLLLLLGLAVGLQSLFFGQPTPYTNDTARFLLRWLTTECIAAALLLPCAAGVLGAAAVPPPGEREAIESALLTQLSAFEIVTGRLLAALWSPVLVLLLSAGVWTILEQIRHFGNGILEIALAHLVLLAALLAGGAVGFLFGLRRSGRALSQGTAVSLLFLGLCVFGLFLLNTQIRRMDAPTPLIEAALSINPVTAVAAALNKDILRVPWIYSRTDAPEYPFSYPTPLRTTAFFAVVALTAQGLAAARLKHLYTSPG